MKIGAALFTIAAGAFFAQDAEAHFRLLFPEPWVQENGLGDPQKAEPCGGEGGRPSNIVTRFRPGETITVRWQETIYHPGHWRIALVENRADLPVKMVTLDAQQRATGASIVDPPVDPIIIDNLFPRTGGGAPESFEYQVTLPNRTCAQCSLQVIQFMLLHGPPNYIYFHCADIEIADANPVDAGVDDMGAPPQMDAQTPPPDTGVAMNDSGASGNADAQAGPTEPDSSCGCKAALKSEDHEVLIFFLFLALIAARASAKKP